MARHALKGKPARLPDGYRPRRHRRATKWERTVLVVAAALTFWFSMTRTDER